MKGTSGARPRENVFLFFNFFPAPRPRRNEMSILPVFLCPHKNRGNAKNAHCWQLLPADLLKRCDDHEWKHYVGYTCKMKAAGKTNTSEVSLISQLFLLNVIKQRAHFVAGPQFNIGHCICIYAFDRWFDRWFLFKATCTAQGYYRFYLGVFKSLRPVYG